jgi:hypothetical protein
MKLYCTIAIGTDPADIKETDNQEKRKRKRKPVKT